MKLDTGFQVMFAILYSKGGHSMKYEWKKQDKDLYGAKKTPTLIMVPTQSYIMISGSGNPNDQDFSNRVAALYALAYAIKMNYKAAAAVYGNEIHDFSVYPLEGVWNLRTGNKRILTKEELEYTIMIRQPYFITEDMVAAALDSVNRKKPNPLYAEMRFDTMQDGKCIEILHNGPYDDEPISFEKMEQFAKAYGLIRKENSHREIYLNHAGRVEISRLKTILRYSVR
jgi:hypothetical protein